MSLFPVADEHLFGVQLLTPVLLFLLKSNTAFTKQLYSQCCTCVLTLPRTRAVGKAALVRGVAHSNNHTWSCLVVVVWEKAKLSLALRSCTSLWLALHSSPSFSIPVRLPDLIPHENITTPVDKDSKIHCPSMHLQHLSPQKDMNWLVEKKL